jgi:type II secretory pathway pseudopilin PulG
VAAVIHRKPSGFTVVEFLVAAVVFVIVTGLAGTYLVAQLGYTQRIQARNEMQANLRSAMEMVTTDLFNAGSAGVGVPCTWSGPSLALDLDRDYAHEITELRYCSPYGTGPVTTSYRLDDDGGVPSLYRGAGPAVPAIVAMEFEVVCADGACDPSNLTDRVLFVRGRMLARTVRPMRGASAAGLMFGGVAATSLQQAPSGFMYEVSERRVVLPNLGR